MSWCIAKFRDLPIFLCCMLSSMFVVMIICLFVFYDTNNHIKNDKIYFQQILNNTIINFNKTGYYDNYLKSDGKVFYLGNFVNNTVDGIGMFIGKNYDYLYYSENNILTQLLCNYDKNSESEYLNLDNISQLNRNKDKVNCQL